MAETVKVRGASDAAQSYHPGSEHEGRPQKPQHPGLKPNTGDGSNHTVDQEPADPPPCPRPPEC